MKSRMHLAQTVCLLCGAYYALAGGLLFFAPRVFFEHVFPVGSFNQHYMTDLGSFLLPLGIALILASRRPGQFAGIIAVAAAASMLHSISHLREGFHSVRDGVANFSLALVALGLFSLLLRKGQERAQ